jgi:uncharacterized protein HemX
MINWPDVAMATALTATMSATMIKIFGNGRKCHVRHEQIYDHIDEKVKERNIITKELDGRLRELDKDIAESNRGAAIRDTQIKSIQEALHDIKRSQEDILHILTGRAKLRGRNGDGANE